MERKDAKSGHCLVAWTRSCRPLELGGFGISTLQYLGWALGMISLLLPKTDLCKLWSAFLIHVAQSVRAFFSMAVVSEVGNGEQHFFLDG